MDSHRITGGLEEVVGAAEEKAAKLTGDRQAEARGAFRHTRGKLERQASEVLDTLRDVVRDRPLLTIGVAGAMAALLGASLLGRQKDQVRPAKPASRRSGK